MPSSNATLTGLDAFCGDVFWDYGSVPSAAVPDFSVCFQHTVLVWVPSAFFWIFAPILALQLRREDSPSIPWSLQVLAKMALSLILVLDAAAVLITTIVESLNGENPSGVQYVYPTILLITMSAICVSMYICRVRGKITSGVLFLSHLIFGLAGIPEFYWWIQQAADPNTSSSLDLPRFAAFIVWFPVIWFQVILLCFADKRASYEKYHVGQEKPSPELHSSFLSRVTLSWFNPIPAIGIKKPLVIEDLYNLNKTSESRYLVPLWEKEWEKAMQEHETRKEAFYQENTIKNGGTDPIKTKAKLEDIQIKLGKSNKPPKPPSIIWRLFKLFWSDIVRATVVKAAADSLQVVNPLLLSFLLTFAADGTAPLWQGIGIAVAMFVTSEMRSFFLMKYFYLMFRAGINIQSVLIAAVYKKTLRLSNAARRQKTAGEIVNLMAIDADRFQLITPQIQQYWSSPFQIILAMIFLWRTLGPSVITGILVMVIFIPLNFGISIFVKKLQVKQMRCKDERIKMTNEVLNGIKVIKLYAWEKSMERLIEEIRNREIALIRKAALLKTVVDTCNLASPFLVAVLTFATYILSDPSHILTPSKAFVSLTLFNQLRVPMTQIADLVSQTVQVMVSNKRLKDFLAAEELCPTTIDKRPTVDDFADTVETRDAAFSWDKSDPMPTLKDINILAPKGNLIAIVGKVGAGKSSLLSAVLGEMDKLRGYVGSRGKVAYVPQLCWIQNITLRDNIVFGKPFDQKFYDRVVDACALRPDLAILPAGDLTEIGEKGINLSGGQKARVSLARAVYQNYDVYLLDDPLSAVDSHVGKHIFDNVIGPDGMLRNKTRILVTHGLTYLKYADPIVCLVDGKITEAGSYADLMKSGAAFAQLIEELSAEREEKEEPIGEEVEEMEEIIDDLTDISYVEVSMDTDMQRRPVFQTQTSTVSNMANRDRSSSDAFARKRISSIASNGAGAPLTTSTEAKKGTKLIQVERAETGRVKFNVYLKYFHSMSNLLSFGFFAGMITNSALSMGRSIWLSHWSNDAAHIKASGSNGTEDLMPVGTRLGVYAAIGFTEVGAMAVGLTSLMLGGVVASRNLHAPLVHNLLRSPMSFFDTTPIGRVLNRCGKEIETIDLRLAQNFRFFAICILQVISTLIIIVMSTPMFIVVVIPLAIIYIYALRYYIATSRQLKRLESITRSPIYSHFGESIQGAPSIRAYGLVDEFCQMSEQKVDTHLRCKYLNLIANRWLSVRLELVGNCVVLFAALFAVLSREWNPVSAGVIGLSVSYSLNITNFLNMAVRQVSDLETNIVSVERVKEYTETPTEAAWESAPGKKPPSGWPKHGRVQIENYSTRYRPGLSLVLRGLTADIAAGEKVGIVGRTGAGKSSMALSLFRLIEAAEGRISIDGEDVSAMGLHDLRSNLTIIPQDPVLFSGTLRINLDPFGLNNDVDIWIALEHAHLKEFVTSLPKKLDHEITEGGDNLSVGQRQLICLARALLRKSKVLILDEATAAVDVSTDALIQKTIRKEFAECTVLTVAHRLNTILDYDRVMVLDHGSISEFDSPQSLLANSNSVFYSMVKDANLIG
uniref:ABC-type glutathione-S-conjugate transporter n=1 Tax=Plectus sambesii TaxID=2011161 RepID=A0A914ULK3_9BILA